MLKLRLQRRGKKNYATYRLVVAEQRAPIRGKFLEDVGSYNPHTKALAVQKDMVHKWLSAGARPSATVHNLLVSAGILQGEKVRSWRPKIKPEEKKVDQDKTS